MFHLELRQFPHVARVFNLDRDELDARFVRPWVAGSAVEHDERRFLPDRARLTIFEGPALRPEEIGMGRGWATVGKTSVEVTEAVLAEAKAKAGGGVRGTGDGGRDAIESVKGAIRVAARSPIRFGDAVELAVAIEPGLRASQALALAEQAVWELLHQGGLTLCGPDGPVERERWQAVVIAWETWTDSGSRALTLQASEQVA